VGNNDGESRQVECRINPLDRPANTLVNMYRYYAF